MAKIPTTWAPNTTDGLNFRANGLYKVVIGAVVLFFFVHYLRNIFRTGLRRLPGPFLAHATSLYRIKLVWKGGAVNNYLALHKKYGSIVRTGSNHVSVADPAAMPLIYGISSKFRKVRRTTIIENIARHVLMVVPVHVLQAITTIL